MRPCKSREVPSRPGTEASETSGRARVVKWAALRTQWLSAFTGSNPVGRIRQRNEERYINT